jgi:mono/diheme cytochrome c family protein
MKSILLTLLLGFIFINSQAQIDYESQIQPIFNSKCVSCHGGTNGVSLNNYNATMSSVGNSYSKLIVTPGNATQSPLYDKLLSNPQKGSRMPQGSSLSQTQIDLIKDWINQGATEVATSVEDEMTPSGFALLGNYPNPFNPSTIVSFSNPVSSSVTMTVFSSTGEKVLSETRNFSAGKNEFSVQLANYASGMYLYQLSMNGSNGQSFSAVGKMMLIK